MKLSQYLSVFSGSLLLVGCSTMVERESTDQLGTPHFTTLDQTVRRFIQEALPGSPSGGRYPDDIVIRLDPKADSIGYLEFYYPAGTEYKDIEEALSHSLRHLKKVSLGELSIWRDLDKRWSIALGPSEKEKRPVIIVQSLQRINSTRSPEQILEAIPDRFKELEDEP